ncbi:MAG: response regulator [Gammaproteobacteria bacterium]|nr:response regulator [Gammaproteobacteria bacterium]
MDQQTGPAVQISSEKPAEATATDRKPHILLVDDSRVVRYTLVKCLSPYFHTIEAENGVAGWRVINQNSRIELVISDIQMPEMDGYTFICKIRAADDPGLRDIPVVVITSAEDDITRQRAFACGANDFVLKPFNTKQLLGCINSQLADHHDATAQVEEEALAATTDDGEMVLPNAEAGSLNSAMAYIDAGMKMLMRLNSAVVSPHALTLVLRFMPLLKFCNIKFKLGMDHEISVFHQRVKIAHDTHKASHDNR